MPCGTTIFFFGPVKDDLWGFIELFLVSISLGAVIVTPVMICGFCFIFTGEILESIMKSPLYQGLFPSVRYIPDFQRQYKNPRYRWFSKMLEWLVAQSRSMRNAYGEELGQYFRALDGQDRRCMPVFKELSVRH